MRSLYKCLIFIALTITHGLSAKCTIYDPGISFANERDYQAVQEFVNSKRTIPLAEKDKIIKIYGDMRADYFHRDETQDGRHLRGHHVVDRNGVPVSKDAFEVELNLWTSYKTPRTWGYFHAQFDNSVGIGIFGLTCQKDTNGLFGSGFCDDLCVKRAYMGWRAVESSCWGTLDFEVGRRPLYTILDSRIEFNSRADGILAKWDKKIEKFSDLFLTIGAFVVSFRDNHYAYYLETGVYDLFEKKIDIKYSFIDWDTQNRNECNFKHPEGDRFQVSQISLGYDFPRHYLKRKAKLYGAFLINTDAKKGPIFLPLEDRFVVVPKANIGWYAGFIIGEVNKKGDWSFDMNYQYVEAKAIPDRDVRGIGRGNVLGESFSGSLRGRTNYKGWHLEGLYAITDALSLDVIYDFSRDIDSKIGGKHGYNKFEMDLILAF